MGCPNRYRFCCSDVDIVSFFFQNWAEREAQTELDWPYSYFSLGLDRNGLRFDFSGRSTRSSAGGTIVRDTWVVTGKEKRRKKEGKSRYSIENSLYCREEKNKGSGGRGARTKIKILTREGGLTSNYLKLLSQGHHFLFIPHSFWCVKHNCIYEAKMEGLCINKSSLSSSSSLSSWKKHNKIPLPVPVLASIKNNHFFLM